MTLNGFAERNVEIELFEMDKCRKNMPLYLVFFKETIYLIYFVKKRLYEHKNILRWISTGSNCNFYCKTIKDFLPQWKKPCIFFAYQIISYNLHRKKGKKKRLNLTQSHPWQIQYNLPFSTFKITVLFSCSNVFF